MQPRHALRQSRVTWEPAAASHLLRFSCSRWTIQRLGGWTFSGQLSRRNLSSQAWPRHLRATHLFRGREKLSLKAPRLDAVDRSHTHSFRLQIRRNLLTRGDDKGDKDDQPKTWPHGHQAGSAPGPGSPTLTSDFPPTVPAGHPGLRTHVSHLTSFVTSSPWES